jgi:hypothetical protein
MLAADAHTQSAKMTRSTFSIPHPQISARLVKSSRCVLSAHALRAALCFKCSMRGSVSSVAITAAPHEAATSEGTARPQPISSTVRPTRCLRRANSHRARSRLHDHTCAPVDVVVRAACASLSTSMSSPCSNRSTDCASPPGFSGGRPCVSHFAMPSSRDNKSGSRDARRMRHRHRHVEIGPHNSLFDDLRVASRHRAPPEAGFTPGTCT